jgi:8-oxo-dGTP pyrophosphatase MutT (NUDIX family)
VAVAVADRRQCAALPFAFDEQGEIIVLLVTSRETRRWVLPKGWRERGEPPFVTAAREAYEEAGAIGTVSEAPVGTYTYEKKLRSGRRVRCAVDVFPLAVQERLPRWPEQDERVAIWVQPSVAAMLVQEPDLSEIISAARSWAEQDGSGPAPADA